MKGFVTSQNWVSYVQTGKIIDLYIVSLFDKESFNFDISLSLSGNKCIKTVRQILPKTAEIISTM